MRIFLLSIFILVSGSLFAANVDCPPKYKGLFTSEQISKLLMENEKLEISDSWKKLSSSEKKTCEKIFNKKIKSNSKKQDKNIQISKRTFDLSNLKSFPFHIIGFIVLWSGIAFSIYNNWVKQSAKLPMGSNKQKFSTLMKSIVPIGVATLVITTVIAVMLPNEAYDTFSPILAVLGWVAFIGYAFFMYNKIYLQDNISRKNYTPTSATKVSSSIKSKEEIKYKKKPKEILTWDEPAKPEPKKEEPQSAEVTITPQEEEAIYAQVAKELKENRNEGVWLKAFTENDGDETKTKITYTKKRVQELIDELKK